MGLFNFFMNKNSKIGGTTRWIVETYKTIKINNPSLSHLELLKLVNSARCAGYTDRSIIDELNYYMGSDEKKSLSRYIYFLIQTESGCIELPKGCYEVVIEELAKSGLGSEVTGVF